MTSTLTCPICGKRNAYEFTYGGEDNGPPREEPDLTPEAWYERVHVNDSAAGVQKEWWNHRDGCGVWFTLFRDTLTNREVDPDDTDLSAPQKPEAAS